PIRTYDLRDRSLAAARRPRLPFDISPPARPSPECGRCASLYLLPASPAPGNPKMYTVAGPDRVSQTRPEIPTPVYGHTLSAHPRDRRRACDVSRGCAHRSASERRSCHPTLQPVCSTTHASRNIFEVD